MANPFIGEIRIFSFGSGVIPNGWAQCNGQLLAINQNQALFALIGTTYGGNGQTTFALPNLQASIPIGVGTNYVLGQSGGEASHTVTAAEMPAHNHVVQATSAAGTQGIPSTSYLGASAAQPYAPADSNLASMSTFSIVGSGGSTAHENRQPYLTFMFCIALQGIFPSVA